MKLGLNRGILSFSLFGFSLLGWDAFAGNTLTQIYDCNIGKASYEVFKKPKLDPNKPSDSPRDSEEVSVLETKEKGSTSLIIGTVQREKNKAGSSETGQNSEKFKLKLPSYWPTQEVESSACSATPSGKTSDDSEDEEVTYLKVLEHFISHLPASPEEYQRMIDSHEAIPIWVHIECLGKAKKTAQGSSPPSLGCRQIKILDQIIRVGTSEEP